MSIASCSVKSNCLDFDSLVNFVIYSEISAFLMLQQNYMYSSTIYLPKKHLDKQPCGNALRKKITYNKKNYQIALNLINPLKEKLGPSRPALNFLFKVSNFSNCLVTWPVVFSRYGKPLNSFPAVCSCELFILSLTISSVTLIYSPINRTCFSCITVTCALGMSCCLRGQKTIVLIGLASCSKSTCMLLCAYV